MAAKAKTTGLQINEDMDFQRLEWRIERIGWGIIALIIIAALLGLLGNGPLSAAVKTGGSLQVEYDRFLHRDAPSSYRIHFTPPDADTAIHLNHQFLEAVKLDQIVPQPSEVELGTDGILLRFRSRPSVTGVVTIPFEPQTMGLLHTRIRVASEKPVTLIHIVYP
jgi:hypothetical protein